MVTTATALRDFDDGYRLPPSLKDYSVEMAKNVSTKGFQIPVGPAGQRCEDHEGSAGGETRSLCFCGVPKE